MEAATQKLKQDLQTLVADAEELLKATASQTGERIEKARARADESMRAAQARLREAGASAAARARAAALGVNGHVHENPWSAVGLAAGVGIVLGILIGRK